MIRLRTTRRRWLSLALFGVLVLLGGCQDVTSGDEGVGAPPLPESEASAIVQDLIAAMGSSVSSAVSQTLLSSSAPSVSRTSEPPGEMPTKGMARPITAAATFRESVDYVADGVAISGFIDVDENSGTITYILTVTLSNSTSTGNLVNGDITYSYSGTPTNYAGRVLGDLGVDYQGKMREVSLFLAFSERGYSGHYTIDHYRYEYSTGGAAISGTTRRTEARAIAIRRQSGNSPGPHPSRSLDFEPLVPLLLAAPFGKTPRL